MKYIPLIQQLEKKNNNPLRLLHKNDVRCLFAASCLYDGLLCFLCMIAHSDVQHFVISYVFTFRVLSCDVRYDFRIKTMFGSSLPPVVCRLAHVLFTLFVCVRVQQYPTHIDYMSNMEIVSLETGTTCPSHAAGSTPCF